MNTETLSRAAFELVSEAVESIDHYTQSRDRDHLMVARSKLDQAIARDSGYLNAVFYSGVVSDLIGDVNRAVSQLRTVLAEVPENKPAVRDQIRYNLAVSLYHHYSRRWLEQAEQEFLAVLKSSREPLLQCLALAGLAQTYAMWEIPPNPDFRDEREEQLLDAHFAKSQSASARAIDGLARLDALPESTRNQVRATAANARGMALMYYTDYRPPGRLDSLQKALSELHQADELLPMDWANTCDLASCHMRLGYWTCSEPEFEKCRQYLEWVIETLRPGYGFARYELGRSYRLQGRFDEALEQFALTLAIPAGDRDVGDRRLNREIALAEDGETRYP